MQFKAFSLAPLCLAISVVTQAQDTAAKKKPAAKKAEYAIEEVFITGVRQSHQQGRHWLGSHTQRNTAVHQRHLARINE